MLPNGTPLPNTACNPGVPLTGIDANCHVFELACTGGVTSCTFDTGAPVADQNACEPDLSLGRTNACCNGHCIRMNQFCGDGDADGHGVNDNSNLLFQCSTATPPGFSPLCDDFCDSDARAFPGSTWCDTAPIVDFCGGGFDFNGDGLETPVTCDLTTHTITNGPLDCANVASCSGTAGSCTQVGCVSSGAGQNCDGACSWLQTSACGTPEVADTVFCDPSCLPTGSSSSGQFNFQPCN